MELHELSFTTNMFSAISDQNIEDADDTYGNTDEMGMMGGEQPGMGGIIPAATPPGAELPESVSQVPAENNLPEGLENE